jgi:hypothetical protein
MKEENAAAHRPEQNSHFADAPSRGSSWVAMSAAVFTVSPLGFNTAAEVMTITVVMRMRTMIPATASRTPVLYYASFHPFSWTR